MCLSVSRQSTNSLSPGHSRMISSENELFVPRRSRHLLERRLSHPALLHSIISCKGRFVQTAVRHPFDVLTFNHLLLIDGKSSVNQHFVHSGSNFQRREVVISKY